MEALVYQYAIGGIVFCFGLFVGFRHGYLGWRGRGLTRLLGTLAVGTGFLLLQAWLQLGEMATREAIPYTGDGHRPETLGTALDYAIIGAYFLAILVLGTVFARGHRTTRDFFLGDQRFSWWLIAMSLVASTVGSYSFVKYSEVGFQHGISSSQAYLNDWIWMPLLLFGWLPLLYFSGVSSIPEYFHRRFGTAVRNAVTALLLLYLVGYIGVNLFTMGKAIHALVGWPVWWSSLVVAVVSALYVTAGGQTSVIMTDLFQGVVLLIVGGLIVVLGAMELGGLSPLWEHLPRAHRLAFDNFNQDASFNAVGIFWQDAMANTAMFYFINQGMVMRLQAARSTGEARKAVLATFVVLMPIAAIVVSSGGWVAKSLVHAGVLPADLEADDAFYVATEFLSRPGVFGLVMAALVAALMSTVDTLITAVAAIIVNDVYRPLRPQATEASQLSAARWSSVAVAVVGVALVPLFMGFDSIYAAHGAFTAAVTPPLVVALLLGVFWRRFTTAGALATLLGGFLAICASIAYPTLIEPFAHGVEARAADGFLAGLKAHTFMRALFGLCASATLGIVVSLLTRPRPSESLGGLVLGTLPDAIARLKGAPGREAEGPWALARLRPAPADGDATLSASLAGRLDATAGDILFVTDSRRWLGGLRACRVRVGALAEDDASWLALGPDPLRRLGSPAADAKPFRVRRVL